MRTITKIILAIEKEMASPERECFCVEANAIDACRRFLESVDIKADAANQLRIAGRLSESDKIVNQLMAASDEISNLRKRTL